MPETRLAGCLHRTFPDTTHPGSVSLPRRIQSMHAKRRLPRHSQGTRNNPAPRQAWIRRRNPQANRLHNSPDVLECLHRMSNCTATTMRSPKRMHLRDTHGHQSASHVPNNLRQHRSDKPPRAIARHVRNRRCNASTRQRSIHIAASARCRCTPALCVGQSPRKYPHTPWPLSAHRGRMW